MSKHFSALRELVALTLVIGLPFVCVLLSATVGARAETPPLFSVVPQSAQMHGCDSAPRSLTFTVKNERTLGTAAISPKPVTILVRGEHLSGAIPYPSIPALGTASVSVNLTSDPDSAGSSFTISVVGADPSDSVLQSLTATATAAACTLTGTSQIVTRGPASTLLTMPSPSPSPSINRAGSAIAQQMTANIEAGVIAQNLADFEKDRPGSLRIIADQACIPQGQIVPFGVNPCIDTGTFDLTFSYDNAASIDAFRIYQVGAPHTPVASLKASQTTMHLSKPIVSGSCIFIVAVKSGTESNPSAKACAQSTADAQAAAAKALAAAEHTDPPIAPDATRSYLKYRQNNLGSMLSNGSTRVTDFIADKLHSNLYGDSQEFKSGTVSIPSVGYGYDTHSGARDTQENFYVRYGAHFDVKKYAKNKIISATFEVQASSSVVDWLDHSGNCAQELAAAGNDWFSDPNGSLDAADFKGQAYLFAGTGSGTSWNPNTTETIDITNLVQQWVAHPDENHGIFLRNQDENLQVFEERSCLSFIKGVALHVTYV